MNTVQTMNKTHIELISTGYQNCSDLHSWGPGVRPCYIIHYVKNGSGTLEIANKKYQISEGECFLTRPYELIHYYPNPQDPWTYYWIDFVGKNVDEYLDSTIFSKKSPVHSLMDQNAFESYFIRLQKIDILSQNRYEANGLLFSILGILTDAKGTENKEDTLFYGLELIHSNYHKSSFTIEILCDKLGVSQATLYRIFQQTQNMSPKQYLTQYRIKQAKLLLSMGNTVKATALSCGYDDPLYFSRVFKQATGMSPSEQKNAAIP